MDDRRGERGVRPLRQILDRHAFRLSDTELEVLFRPIARSAGLPEPLTKQMVRFAHYQVKYEPDYVRGVLEATAANLSGRPAPAPGR